MNKDQLNKYYQKLIDQLTQINNNIVNLNGQYSSTIGALRESLVIDNKIVGEGTIKQVKETGTSISNEIINQIIPDLSSKIR